MFFVNKSIEYTYQDAKGGSSLASMSSSHVLLKIKETSCAAVGIYDHLQLGKKWNLLGKHANDIILLLYPSVTTVAIPIIWILSAPNLAMMKSAKNLVKLKKRHETLSKVEVVEDVEIEVTAKVMQVVGLSLMGRKLLGTVK